MSLAEIAAADDQLATLRGLRDRLAEQLDLCESARDFAALSSRLESVLTTIADLEPPKPAAEGTALDEFTRRRAERSAPGATGAAKHNQRG